MDILVAHSEGGGEEREMFKVSIIGSVSRNVFYIYIIFLYISLTLKINKNKPLGLFGSSIIF